MKHNFLEENNEQREWFKRCPAAKAPPRTCGAVSTPSQLILNIFPAEQ
ncbi:MAG: hypothetical protein KAH99_02080 [Verrucomicrobia bacterium]|nr:hypothetical protein [Verrucomicrobiota bacterium]